MLADDDTSRAAAEPPGRSGVPAQASARPATNGAGGPGSAGGPDSGASAVTGLGPVFARSPVAMAVVDGTGRVLEANDALSAYLGHDPAAMVGTHLDEHLAPDDGGRLKHGSAERRLRHARGHELWAVVSVVPMPEAGG